MILWVSDRQVSTLLHAVVALLVTAAAGGLTGCATPGAAAARQLTAFPTARDVAPTPEAQRLLREAKIDFDRVRAGERPVYAQFSRAPRIGSRIFANIGYSIEDSPILVDNDDRMFHRSGVRITLRPPITASAVSYQEIWLVRRSFH